MVVRFRASSRNVCSLLRLFIIINWFFFFQNSSFAAETTDDCLTASDVDGESCKLENLSDEALIDTCTSIGVDVEFALALAEEFEGKEFEGAVKDIPPVTTKTNNTIYKKEEYVKAADICLAIKREESLILKEYIREFELLLEEDPTLFETTVEELKSNYPDTYNSVFADIDPVDLLSNKAEYLARAMLEIENSGEGIVGYEEVLQELKGDVNKQEQLEEELQSLYPDIYQNIVLDNLESGKEKVELLAEAVMKLNDEVTYESFLMLLKEDSTLADDLEKELEAYFPDIYEDFFASKLESGHDRLELLAKAAVEMQKMDIINDDDLFDLFEDGEFDDAYDDNQLLKDEL